MNTGLGDAENLAWKLALVATGRAQTPLLDSYQAERRPIAQEVLDSTSGMLRIIVGRTPLTRAVCDHLFVPLMNRPFIQRLIWEESSPLKVNYRRGPLAGRSLAALPGRGPYAGDRVPDLACTRRFSPCGPTARQRGGLARDVGDGADAAERHDAHNRGDKGAEEQGTRGGARPRGPVGGRAPLITLVRLCVRGARRGPG